MGLSAAFGQWHEAWGATEQLVLNVVILLAVGVVALILQRRFWQGRDVGPRSTGEVEPTDGGSPATGDPA
jgi:hypothetical protein